MQENSYIKKYIETLSPEGFEQICVEYLQLKKGNQYIVHGTKFIKDGGKDIVGKASNDIPYEIWAECKKHTRSIGLEEISKNVVLVMSYGINELIFFSTSNITETAKLHISKVASKHDFSIGFYYGEKLYNELAILPIFSYSSKIQNDNQSINISVNLSKYKNPESYEKENFIKLTRDTTFYIYITIDNNSSYNMYDVCINIQDNSNMLFHISSYDNNFKLPTSCERIVQIQVDILNLKKILYIPNVEISYKTSDNNEKKSEFYVGNVDPTGLLYFPIISQKTNDYLSNVVQKSIGKYSDFSLFDIRGISGVGKTRLIKEISKIASFKNWNIINYDGKINKNFAPVKDLLCQLIGLPYLSHNINISPADIKNILAFHNDNIEFSNIIYNFIYKDIYDKETLYYIKNVFTYFLSRPYLSMPNILILDNFQDFNEIVIKSVAEKVSTPVLLQVREHFAHRAEHEDVRVFFPKGSLAKCHCERNKLPDIDERYCQAVVRICENALAKLYGQREPMGKVYLSEDYKNYVVPFSQRSANKALKTIVRGSRLPVSAQTNAVRAFIWWTNMYDMDFDDWRVDIDLSAAIFDENWNYVEHVSYTNLKSEKYMACHSGDIVNGGPVDGAGVSEFLDVDIDSVVRYGARYVVYELYSYTEQRFADMPHAMFGWMERADVNSGKIYEPGTVEQRMDLTSKSTVCIPVIFDCVSREFIWCDMGLSLGGTHRNIGGNNLESNLSGTAAVCYSMVNVRKPNLYDLIALNVMGRGMLVENKEDADIVFDTVLYQENDDKASEKRMITPFDTDVLMSEYL